MATQMQYNLEVLPFEITFKLPIYLSGPEVGCPLD